MPVEIPEQIKLTLIRALMKEPIAVSEAVEALQWIAADRSTVSEALRIPDGTSPLHWFFDPLQMDDNSKKAECVSRLREWFNISMFEAKEILMGQKPVPLTKLDSESQEYVLKTLRSLGAVFKHTYTK